MRSKRMVGCLRVEGGEDNKWIGEGSSEGFVERVFELEANVFI